VRCVVECRSRYVVGRVSLYLAVSMYVSVSVIGSGSVLMFVISMVYESVYVFISMMLVQIIVCNSCVV
jgi:hypothetical protein